MWTAFNCFRIFGGECSWRGAVIKIWMRFRYDIKMDVGKIHFEDDVVIRRPEFGFCQRGVLYSNITEPKGF
jgi:hypothetical protein